MIQGVKYPKQGVKYKSRYLYRFRGNSKVGRKFGIINPTMQDAEERFETPNKPLTRYFIVIVVIVDFVFCWKVITMSCQMRYGRSCKRSIIMYLSRGRGVGQHSRYRSLSIKVCGHLMSPFLYMVPSSISNIQKNITVIFTFYFNSL